MANVFIGIDPGKSGGMAFLYTDAIEYPVLVTMPVAGKELDIAAIAEWLRKCHDVKHKPIAFVEKVHAMPGQGVSSMFSFGFVTGVIHGVVTTLNIPLYLVAPQTWKKVILADTDKSKEAAIEFCRRTYPQASLLPTARSYKPNSGMADALCIAHYGRERFKDVV